MYQVIHQPSGQEINILAVLWARQIDYLRSLDKKDALVCPACEQPVRVRAGKFKRHHFAHKHLENCPFQKESPELLQARAVLYHWLTEKFGTEAVSIEKQIPAPIYSAPWIVGWILVKLTVGIGFLIGDCPQLNGKSFRPVLRKTIYQCSGSFMSMC